MFPTQLVRLVLEVIRDITAVAVDGKISKEDGLQIALTALKVAEYVTRYTPTPWDDLAVAAITDIIKAKWDVIWDIINRSGATGLDVAAIEKLFEERA